MKRERRLYPVTKEQEYQLMLHEELLEMLEEQNRLLRHLVKLERADLQQEPVPVTQPEKIEAAVERKRGRPPKGDKL